MTYKITAYHDDAVYVVGKHIETIEDAEAMQARFYAQHEDVDFYIDGEQLPNLITVSESTLLPVGQANN